MIDSGCQFVLFTILNFYYKFEAHTPDFQFFIAIKYPSVFTNISPLNLWLTLSLDGTSRLCPVHVLYKVNTAMTPPETPNCALLRTCPHCLAMYSGPCCLCYFCRLFAGDRPSRHCSSPCKHSKHVLVWMTKRKNTVPTPAEKGVARP